MQGIDHYSRMFECCGVAPNGGKVPEDRLNRAARELLSSLPSGDEDDDDQTAAGDLTTPMEADTDEGMSSDEDSFEFWHRFFCAAVCAF